MCFKDLNFSDEELYKIIKGLRKKSKFIRLSKNVIFKADEETGAQLLNVVDEFNLKTDKLNENQQIPLYQGMKLMSEENIQNYGKINMDDTIQNMISETISNGIDSVTTSTGYTFDKDGLHIAKTGEEMKNTIDNTGVYVDRDDDNVLTANNEGVIAINLTARQYLTIGDNSRLENYKTNRTACFHIGGDN